MDDKNRIISCKIGRRRIRVDLAELEFVSKLTIRVLFPDDINENLHNDELAVVADDYTSSIEKEVQQTAIDLIENQLSIIDTMFITGSKLLQAKKDPILWQFKLTAFDDPFDTDNYEDKIKSKFSNLIERIEKVKEQLKSKQIVEEYIDNNPYLSTFPLARGIQREFIFNLGPTNSGKTFASLNELKAAKSGCYLAPLRLLAHEVYDDLNKDGYYTSLVTGEEIVEVPGSTYRSSTIEMADTNTEVDVAVIDEIQMIMDQYRGWAWTQAVCGIPAKKVILAGSEEALPFVKKLVEEILKEKLTVVRFERKNELIVQDSCATDIQDNDAIIVFSRKRVFEMKHQLENNCSIIYGSLSPDVRKSEARKFRESENKTVVSTDAIGMGLNLPIRRVVFADEMKFDGKELSKPDSQLIKQIAGRAGRFGKFEAGYVTAMNDSMLSYVKKCMTEDRTFDATKYKFQVSPNIKAIEMIAQSLKTVNIVEVLHDLRDIINYDSKFTMMNLDSMIEVSQHVNRKLDLGVKYIYCCAPINTKSDFDKIQIEKWTRSHFKGKTIQLSDIPKSKSIEGKKEQDKLWYLENEVKLLTVYQWLNRRFPEIYTDIDNVVKRVNSLNSQIMRILDAKRNIT